MNILNSIDRIYGTKAKTEPHRLLAWERCYRYFNDNKDALRRDLKTTGKLSDMPMLHLATYLANWGMYVGDTFLLKTDYTVFDGITKEILNKDYDSLWTKDRDIDSVITSDGTSRKEFIEKITTASKKIKEVWARYPVNDLLLTKILMATYGCVPAYDKFVKNGMKQKQISPAFGKKSINGLLDFYCLHWEEFNLSTPLHIGGGEYPIMRKMDMYFFVAGGALNQK
ncbi:MAG: hypothetical protein FWG80_04980 [Alphaproteobacteria bacterium]|nr:hypothetical protein [Alphaproteobacteria bacterium]